MAVESSVNQMADLERRVRALEEQLRRTIWNEPPQQERERVLVAQYGECVDKTRAASILGVTRVTVYAMLADGRIRGACAGRKVDVRSIAQYLNRTTKKEMVS